VPVNISGYWDSEARRWHFELEQKGSQLTGALLGYRNVYYRNPGAAELKITGTVDAKGQVAFQAQAYGLWFDGALQPGSLRMLGTTFDCGDGCRKYGDTLVKQP